jgi:hypothetical protein
MEQCQAGAWRSQGGDTMSFIEGQPFYGLWSHDKRLIEIERAPDGRPITA